MEESGCGLALDLERPESRHLHWLSSGGRRRCPSGSCCGWNTSVSQIRKSGRVDIQEVVLVLVLVVDVDVGGVVVAPDPADFWALLANLRKKRAIPRLESYNLQGLRSLQTQRLKRRHKNQQLSWNNPLCQPVPPRNKNHSNPLPNTETKSCRHRYRRSLQNPGNQRLILC